MGASDGEREVSMNDLTVQLQTDCGDLLAQVAGFTLAPGELEITTIDEAEMAADTRKRLKGLASKIEEARKERKAPFLSASREVDQFFAPAAQRLETMAGQIGQSLLRWQAAERKRVAEEEAAARVEAERIRQEALKLMAAPVQDEATVDTADMLLAQAEVAQYIPPPAKIESFGSRSNWKMRVVDPDLFYRTAPAEYKMPNESALNAEARRTKGKAVIPGCECYDDRIATL